MDNQAEIYNAESRIELGVYETLKAVMDPEIGINIIDLGLVYTINYKKEEGIHIVMTFSSEGCPMGDVILADVDSVLENDFPGIARKVDITWEPRWSRDFITPAGRELLGL